METSDADAVTRRLGRKRQTIAALIADQVMLAYGLAVGWPAAALPQLLGAGGPSPLASGPVSQATAAWLVAAFCLAGAPAGPLFGVAAERLGAVRTGQLAAGLHAAACAAVALAQGPVLLLVARTAAGCAAAAGFVFVPLYTREVSDERMCGPLGALMTVLLNVGVVGAFTLGACLPLRVAAAVSAVPSLVFLALSVTRWLPEAPALLLRRGRRAHAEHALRWLRGGADVSQELRVAEAAIGSAGGSGGRVAFWEALRRASSSRAARRAVLLSVVLILNQQLSGLFALLSYVVIIFMEAEVELSPYISSIVVGIMLTTGSILCMALVSRWRRKSLLCVSDVFMALGLFAMGMYFYLKRTGVDTSNLSWLPLTSLSVHMIMFNFGLGSMPLVIMTELFSPELVSAALTLNGPLAGISSFVISRYYPDAAEWLGIDVCLWFFAGSCVLGMVLLMVFLPETKDVPLEVTLRRLEGMEHHAQKTSYNAIKTEELDLDVIAKISCVKEYNT